MLDEQIEALKQQIEIKSQELIKLDQDLHTATGTQKEWVRY